MTEGIIQNIVGASPRLYTLRFPAQPQVERTLARLEACEIQILAFARSADAHQGLLNAMNLLEVLYRRGVTDAKVLKVLLEATGHPETQNLEDSRVSSPSPIPDDQHDHR